MTDPEENGVPFLFHLDPEVLGFMIRETPPRDELYLRFGPIMLERLSQKFGRPVADFKLDQTITVNIEQDKRTYFFCDLRNGNYYVQVVMIGEDVPLVSLVEKLFN